MSKSMTIERVTEFAAAWNSRNPDLIALLHRRRRLSCIRRTGSPRQDVCRQGRNQEECESAFRFPDGTFEDSKVVVQGHIGTFEWNFVASDATGKRVANAGCDLSS